MFTKSSSNVAGVLLALLLAACGTQEGGTGRGESIQRVLEATPVASQSATVTPTSSEGTAPTAGGETVTTDLTDCTSTLASTYHQVETIEELAWMSHYVVVGTVIDRLPPVWGDGPNPLEPSRRLIYTNSVVQITGLLRGQPAATVLVQQLGGEIDGCVQTHDSEELLEVGDELLLFLRETEETAPGTAGTYYLTAGDQGLWTIEQDGTVSASIGHLQLAYDGTQLSEVVSLIQDTLSGAPPDSPSAPEYFIPITEAPVPTVVAGP